MKTKKNHINVNAFIINATNTAVSCSIIWLPLPEGKMNQILHCDWDYHLFTSENGVLYAIYICHLPSLFGQIAGHPTLETATKTKRFESGTYLTFLQVFSKLFWCTQCEAHYN